MNPFEVRPVTFPLTGVVISKRGRRLGFLSPSDARLLGAALLNAATDAEAATERREYDRRAPGIRSGCEHSREDAPVGVIGCCARSLTVVPDAG